MTEFEEIRRALNLTLPDMAKLLGAKSHSTAHRWESSPDSPSSRKALEKAKELYKKQTKKEWVTKVLPSGGFISREEFAEWRGYWKAGMEKVLERLEALEGQVQKHGQHGKA